MSENGYYLEIEGEESFVLEISGDTLTDGTETPGSGIEGVCGDGLEDQYEAVVAVGETEFIEILDNGLQGPQGATILSGFGAPEMDLGRVGDFYFDRANIRFYGPKTTDSWGFGVSLGLAGSTCAYLTPVEEPDGIIATFTTPEQFVANSLNLYLNGQLLIPGIDYDEDTTSSFTMGEPPLSGDLLRVHVTLA